MKQIFSTITILAVSLTLMVQNIDAQKLTLAGSTTIQKRVLEPTAKAFEEATGIKLNILGIGTGGGFKKLKAGEVVASIASSPMSSILKKAGVADDGTYQEHVVVKDVIVPIVNKRNGVSELTFEQLSDINTGKVTNWKEVGGPDLKINVVTSHSGSATRAVFQKQVMKKAEYVKNAMKVKSTREEVDLVAKLKGGIGAVSEGFVKLNPGKVNTVKTEDISRPLSIITKGNPSKEVQTLLNFLKTDKAKKLFK